MTIPVTHENREIITATEAAAGFQLRETTRAFAFVRTSDENTLVVIPLKKQLKISGVNFNALDFLKFREGIFHPGAPWQFLMIINGLHRIEIVENADRIIFEKMSEVDWQEIIPSLKDMLDFQKPQLLTRR